MRKCLVCGSKLPAPVARGRPTTTCSKACARVRKSEQRIESKERAQQRGIPDNLHGTSTGATYYMCHCPQCRKWWREYQQARRKARKVAGEVKDGVD